MRYSRINCWSDERGTEAVEFALVSPIFILLTIGIIYLCMALWAVGSLHYAVEAGARCASVQPLDPINNQQHDCTDQPTTISYTQNHYFGPNSPNFSYTPPNPLNLNPPPVSCGYLVTGNASYVIDLGLTRVTVPISAQACFPSVPTLNN
jgi:hypothetical protein